MVQGRVWNFKAVAHGYEEASCEEPQLVPTCPPETKNAVICHLKDENRLVLSCSGNNGV